MRATLLSCAVPFFRSRHLALVARAPMSALHATAAAASSSSSSSSNSSPAIFRHRNDFLVSGDDDALKREGSNERYALVMTNSATMDVALAKRFWDRCEYRVCADGGANRLFDGLSAEDRVRYVPDAVKGDLDSVRADVRAFYSAHGCTVVPDGDQDCNDLDKCLQAVKERWQTLLPNDDSAPSPATASVVVLGAFGGRFDQEVAAVHALYAWRGAFHRVVLVGGGNVAELLGAGVHDIWPVAGVEGPTCALLPLGGPAQWVRTRGLEWDLHGQRLEMGLLVSSSNAIADTAATVNAAAAAAAEGGGGGGGGGGREDGAPVRVETSDPVVWMTTLHQADAPSRHAPPR